MAKPEWLTWADVKTWLDGRTPEQLAKPAVVISNKDSWVFDKEENTRKMGDFPWVASADYYPGLNDDEEDDEEEDDE